MTRDPQAFALFETLPHGLLVIGPDGNTRLANLAARRLLHGSATPRGTGEARGSLRGLVGETVQALARAAPGSAIQRRLAFPAGGALRTLAIRVPGGSLVMIVRHEALRWPDACAAVASRFAVAPGDIRLAVRVARGESYAAIALAFGLPEGTVKSRLSRLYARLGTRNRAELVELVRSGGAARELPEPPEVRDAPPALVDAPAVAPAVAPAEIQGWLDRLPLALAALEPSGAPVWSNQACTTLPGFGPSGEGWGRLLDRAPAADRSGASHQPYSIRIGAREGAERVLLWRAATGLWGALVHRERPRAARRRQETLRSFGLSPRQALTAALVTAGHTNVEIAARLGLRRGTVDGMVSRIYARLGVSGRLELVTLIVEEA